MHVDSWFAQFYRIIFKKYSHIFIKDIIIDSYNLKLH